MRKMSLDAVNDRVCRRGGATVSRRGAECGECRWLEAVAASVRRLRCCGRLVVGAPCCTTLSAAVGATIAALVEMKTGKRGIQLDESIVDEIVERTKKRIDERRRRVVDDAQIACFLA